MKLIISLTSLCFLCLTFVSCNDQKEDSNTSRKLEVSKEFCYDSINTISLKKKSIYEEGEIEGLVQLYNRLFKYPLQYESSKFFLLKRFDPIKVTVQVGTIYYDEFTDEFIKTSLKKLTIPFKEYFLSINSSKYIPQRIHRGYKTSKNKKAHKLYYKFNWPKEDCLMVASGQIKIGMNKDMVVAAWGRPYDINRTTYSFGVHEQWVYGEYGSNYVYFEDGKVTAIQN